MPQTGTENGQIGEQASSGPEKSVFTKFPTLFRDNFANLVDELHAAFQPHGWLLTAAVSAATFRINEGYDVPR